MKRTEGYYGFGNYESKARFNSYWHQIDEILSIVPSRVLNVGAGSKFLSSYLKNKGVDIKDVDSEPSLEPDIIGDVRNLPCENGEYDVCACFQVLEHMPFCDIKKSLGELRRVSRGIVVLSLPDVNPVFRIFMELPFVGWFKIMVPKIFVRKRHDPDDHEHFWNIGEKGYSLKRVVGEMEKAGFRVEKTYRVFENPLHRFFILKRVDVFLDQEHGSGKPDRRSQ
jgi:hypothetical protein